MYDLKTGRKFLSGKKTFKEGLLYLIILLCLFFTAPASRADTLMVKLDDFIESSCRNDTAFIEILADELELRYNQVLSLPSKDFLLTIGGEYGVALSGDQQPELNVTLNRLFPLKGSSVEASIYTVPQSGGGQTNGLEFVYSVDVIRNAFGRSQRMLKDIVGLENRVARYQILQAYEDYLAELVRAYYGWMRAYGELNVAESSVEDAQKLLENIKKRQSKYIAYQVDVDKADLQVVDKIERGRQAREEFETATIRVAYSMGKPLDALLIPDTSDDYMELTDGAQEHLEKMIFDSTRTGRIYDALYRRDSLKIERAVEELLPALSVYGGVGLSDRYSGFTDNARVMAGASLSFPFGKSKESARVEVSRIEQRKTGLSASSLRGRMNMRFAQLRTSIESQKEAVKNSQRKLELAKSIYSAETEDYLYGRTNLNDLIQAFNTVQSNRLLTVNSRLDLARISLEALELLDQLVTETEIDPLR